MSPVQEKFESVMRELADFLGSDGFRRARRCFHKLLPGDRVRWSICSQKSRYSTADQIKFTFNIAAEWKRRPASSDEWVPHTTWYPGVGDRVGFLLPQKQDTWWTLDESTPAEVLGNQITTAFSSCILPFFRQFSSEEAITQYLRAREHDTMRRNYPHALTMLEFDLLEKKEKSEIETRIRRIRHIGKMLLVNKAVVDAAIQRVLQAYGYKDPLPPHAPWWKLWA